MPTRLLVETDAELQPLIMAKLLKARIDEEPPGLVTQDRQTIDGGPDTLSLSPLASGITNPRPSKPCYVTLPTA